MENKQKNDFDMLNDLFMFNFNFDKLKQIIIALLQKQNETNNMIALISSRIDNIEGNSTQNITNNNENSQIMKPKPLLPLLNNISNIATPNTETMISNILSTPPLLSNPNSGNRQSNIVDNANIVNSNKEILSSPNVTNDKKIEALAEQIDNQNQVISKINGTVDEISAKIADFDIYEIFKDVGKTNEEGGNKVNFSLDATKMLNENLEKKLMKKITMHDEKIKKLEYESNKYKNDILTIANKNDFVNKNISSIKNEINDYNNKLYQNQINNLKSQIEALTMFTKNNISTIKQSLNQVKNNVVEIESSPVMNDNNNTNNTNTNVNKESNDNVSREQIDINTSDLVSISTFTKFKSSVSKRFIDIDKLITALQNNTDIPVIKDKLISISSSMISKEEFTKEKAKLTNLLLRFESLNDDHNRLDNDVRSISSTVSDMGKHYESFKAYMASLSSVSKKIQTPTYNTSEAQSEGPTKFDPSNYPTMNKLNEAFKSYNNEIGKLKHDLDIIFSILNEIHSRIDNKPDEKDIKTVEIYADSLFNEINKTINGKYSDKFVIGKQFKLVDMEIKKIKEMLSNIESSSQNNNSNTWLLAKRPLMLCASCDNVIDPNTEKKDNYLPWKKLPGYNNDTYMNQTGNGFSRILSLVNLGKNDEDTITVSRNAKKELPRLNETDTNFRVQKKKKMSKVLSSGMLSPKDSTISNNGMESTLEVNSNKEEKEHPKM